MGVAGTLGHLLMTSALRFAPAATLAPMQYLGIPFATLFGWLMFQELPDGFSVVGIMITVAAGLYTVARTHPQPGKSADTTAANAVAGTITSIRAALKCRRTGGVATSFDVPMRPSGAKSMPSIGQRKPRARPVTAPIGNSDRRAPGGRARWIGRAGAQNTASRGPNRMHGGPGCRTSVLKAASA